MISSSLFIWSTFQWLTLHKYKYVQVLSDDSIRTDQAVNQLVLSFTFRIKRVDLSAVWIVTRHPCYEACGPWIGTNLRCLVIMKTYRPSTVHYSPPSLQPEGSVSNHLDRLRFITAHFHRPRSPPRPKLCSRLSVWIFRYTFWTLIIARIDRGEPGQRRQRTHAMRRKTLRWKELNLVGVKVQIHLQAIQSTSYCHHLLMITIHTLSVCL